MWKAATFGLDEKSQGMCSAVGRQAYFGKTRAAGDMLSLDAVYHRACLTKIYRKVETVGCDDTER